MIRFTYLFLLFQPMTVHRESDSKRRKRLMMQSSKLYVSNLGYSTTSEQLGELFSPFGIVKEIKIIEGRGFGFIDMSNQSEAQKAQEALDGSNFQGRTLIVNEARPQKRKERGKTFRRY